jgi:TonB family protein
MSDRNKNRKNSASDFLRYKRGEMTGEERNSFERELQKDPFAEEASEGYELLSPDDTQGDIKNLHKRIGIKTSGKKGFIYYRIAASVAVLMVISTIFILVERNKPEDQLAELEKTSEPFEVAREEPVMEQIAENIKSKTTSGIAEKMGDGAVAGRAAVEVRQEDISAEDKKQAKKDKIDSIADIGVKAADVYLAQENIAAPAAMVKTKSVTDSRIQMNFDTLISALDEVVVVGYGVKREEDVPSGYVAPQPVNGKSAFDKYIEENIHRPDTTTAGQRVVVVINFTVLSDGSIDSIKIVKSPGKAFSDEAIRLIKSGPQWKPAEENGKVIEEEVKLRILFR